MVRATRSRKPHSKYPAGEYELSTLAKKSPIKKTETEAKSVVGGGLRSGLSKGNLKSGLRGLKGTGAIVLRDRTNLHEEAVKVDLLIKQGTDGEMATKATKSTRNRGSKVLEGKDEGEAEKTSSMVGTRKKRKLEIDDETKSREDSKNRKKNRTDDEETAKTVSAPKRSAKSRPGKVEAEIVKKATRGKVSKVEKAADESSDENSNKKANSPDSKGSSLPMTRSSNNRDVGKKSAEKMTRKIVKSTASRGDDDPKLVPVASSKVVRIVTRKIVVERESSTDSGLGTREIAEKEENEELEIEAKSVGGTRKAVERRISRKATEPKKSKENVDFGKKTPRRLLRSKVNEEEAAAGKSVIGEKKFFKTKTGAKKVENLSPVKRTVTAKRRNIGNSRSSVSFRLRQTSLQESFGKQSSRKVLRPRKSEKNYCEQTIVEKKGGKSDLEEGKKTGPVYKTVRQDEDSLKDKNAVYEFQFDSNDSREKLPKKKKRNIRKNIGTKKLAGAKKATNPLKEQRGNVKTTDSKMASGQAGIEKLDLAERVSPEPREMENFPGGIVEPPEENVEKSAKVAEKSSNVVADVKAKPTIVRSVELKGDDRLTLTTTPVLAKSSGTKARNHLRPSKQLRTMLNHALLNKSLSPISKASESFDPGSPWRPPVLQEFSRVKNIVQSTPQVRNFTAALEVVSEKTAIVCNTESKKEQKISAQKSSGEVAGVAKSPRKFGTVISNVSNEQNVAPRIPHSVETNSRNENRESQKIETATIQEPKIGSTAIDTRLTITSSDTIVNDQGMTLHFSNDDFEDKENSLPAVSSSKRSPRKSSSSRTPLGNLNNSPSKNLSRTPLGSLDNSPSKNVNRSPLKNFNKSPLKSVDRPPLENLLESPSKNLQKSPLRDPKKILTMLRAKRMQNENQEPRAGPSSAKDPGSDDSRVLRQSNLDNYLKIDEMPKSTRIITSHGIFDDAHSTPISGKPAKKKVEDANVENAFGFDVSDEDSEIGISPIKKSLPENPPVEGGSEKVVEAAELGSPARVSVEEIKKEILPVAIKEAAAKWKPIIERIEEEIEGKEKLDEEQKKKRKRRVRKIPIILTDTFDLGKEDDKSHDESSDESSSDISSESSEENREESSKPEPVLFADIEPPQHFTQAPKHSYKRKRPFGVSFADVDVHHAEEDEVLDPKRRKVKKSDKKREEQLENWAKDLNKTFEEIDHFDLVVE